MNKEEARGVIATWSGVLPKVLSLMYTETATNKFPSVQVGFGNGAYTDGKKLYVGLDPLFVEGQDGFKETSAILGHEPTMAEAGQLIKSHGFHELYHIFYSSWKEAEIFREWWTENFKELWETEGEIHKNLVTKLGAHFNNAIEDGRIENLGGNTYPGTIKALQFSNLLMWAVHSTHPNESEFVNFSIAACFYATTGLFPEWYSKTTPEMQEAIETIMPDIDDVIKVSSPIIARRKMQKMVLKIHPYILSILKSEMAQADTMKAIQEFIQSMVDEFKGCKASEASKTPDVGAGGLSVKIKIKGSGKGDGKASGDAESSDEDGDKGDEAGKDGSSGGSGDDGAEGDDGKGKDGKDSKDGKDGKDGKSSEGDNESEETGEKPGSSIDNESKAPGYAQRGGKENKDDSSSENCNNNGQGTTDGTNVSPDNSDETVNTTSESLTAAVKEQLDKIAQDANEDFARDKAKAEKSQSATDLDEGVSKEEIEAIRSGYDSPYNVEGYKEVRVNVTAKPDNRVVQEGKRFRKEIEKLLKSQIESKIRGTTRGRLTPSMLYRMQRNDFGIFSTKSSPDKTDAAVYILWDNSGSMYGEKQRLSTIACSVVEEGLKGLVPLKITAFSTEGGMVKHWKIKDFNEHAKDRNYAWGHGTARTFNGGNKDGYSIKVATSEILKRSEQLKLMIILSDGLPSDYPGTTIAMDDVKAAVKDARKNGVEVISVFFGEDEFLGSEFTNYEYMYKTGIVASSPEKLTTELIKQIRKILFNKGR